MPKPRGFPARDPPAPFTGKKGSSVSIKGGSWGFLRVGSSNPPLVWAEEAGKWLKREGQVERETCERDSGENGQFQAKPRQDKGGW